MPRSDRQRDASRTNGQQSKGPKTPAGKARSAQNARSHGLTGRLEADPDEAAYLQKLWLRLSERFDPADKDQGSLIQIALQSELRMLRAYALIRDEVSTLLGTEQSELAQERALAAAMIREIRSTLIEATGDKSIGLTLPRALVERRGYSVPPRTLLKPRLAKLLGYAQRFRGQRDRALKKLEASRR